MTSEARRDLIKGIVTAFFASLKPADINPTYPIPPYKTAAKLKAVKGKPFVMNAVMNLQRGTGWEGIPRLAEVMLDESKDRDDLVSTNIEEIYYFTR